MLFFEPHSRNAVEKNREIFGSKTRDVTVNELENCGKIQNNFEVHSSLI